MKKNRKKIVLQLTEDECLLIFYCKWHEKPNNAKRLVPVYLTHISREKHLFHRLLCYIQI